VSYLILTLVIVLVCVAALVYVMRLLDKRADQALAEQTRAERAERQLWLTDNAYRDQKELAERHRLNADALRAERDALQAELAKFKPGDVALKDTLAGGV
jgi:hypothetical protein